jgi:hypothetical protein
MSNYCSGDHKAGRKERFERLPTEMQNSVHEFELTLQVSENSKDNYLGRMENFANY